MQGGFAQSDRGGNGEQDPAGLAQKAILTRVSAVEGKGGGKALESGALVRGEPALEGILKDQGLAVGGLGLDGRGRLRQSERGGWGRGVLAGKLLGWLGWGWCVAPEDGGGEEEPVGWSSGSCDGRRRFGISFAGTRSGEEHGQRHGQGQASR